jgi:hypothetical protein
MPNLLNEFLRNLSKRLILNISDPEMLIELVQWVESIMPVDYLVVMKINQKLKFQNLRSDHSYTIRRVQTLRHPDIAQILIKNGLVDKEHLACDAQGNLDSTVTLGFAVAWIKEHYS